MAFRLYHKGQSIRGCFSFFHSLRRLILKLQWNCRWKGSVLLVWNVRDLYGIRDFHVLNVFCDVWGLQAFWVFFWGDCVGGFFSLFFHISLAQSALFLRKNQKYNVTSILLNIQFILWIPFFPFMPVCGNTIVLSLAGDLACQTSASKNQIPIHKILDSCSVAKLVELPPGSCCSDSQKFRNSTRILVAFLLF